MTTAFEERLRKSYTQEEQDRMIEAYAQAIRDGDDEKADDILIDLPLDPEWAMNIASVMGKKYLEASFNITDANRKFGEGWLDGL